MEVLAEHSTDAGTDAGFFLTSEKVGKWTLSDPLQGRWSRV